MTNNAFENEIIESQQELREEIALGYTMEFLVDHIHYSSQNNLAVYPPSYICKNRAYFTSEAMLGDPYAQDVLHDFASALTMDGAKLPHWLQEYVVWAARHMGRSRRRRGRNPCAQKHRNGIVANAVQMLVEDGFRATRNPATAVESGCSIVARALQYIGIHMSEANVNAIWRADKALAQGRSPKGAKHSIQDRNTQACEARCRCAPFQCEIHDPKYDYKMAALSRVEQFDLAEAIAAAELPDFTIELAEIVAFALVSEFMEHAGRTSIVGPSARLQAEAAQTIAVVLRELTVHSRICGVFACSQGKLDVRWNFRGANLVLDWSESGVEILHSQPLRGHVRDLIEVKLPSVMQTTTQLEVNSDRLHCRIELSSELLANEQEGLVDWELAALFASYRKRNAIINRAMIRARTAGCAMNLTKSRPTSAKGEECAPPHS
jgi:hypothetical protein